MVQGLYQQIQKSLKMFIKPHAIIYDNFISSDRILSKTECVAASCNIYLKGGYRGWQVDLKY